MGSVPIFVLLCAVVLVMNLKPLRSYDFWQHVASGRLIAERGWVAQADVFSHTAAGKPWIQFGLSQFLIYLGHGTLGVTPLICIKALIAVLAFLLAAMAALYRGVRPAVAAVTAAEAALVASLRSFLRPEILSVLLIAAFVLVMEGVRRGRTRRLWLLPVLMAVWVNVHGAFVAGLVYLGCVATGQTLKYAFPRRLRIAHPPTRSQVTTLWVVLAACAAATLLNPYGYPIWRVPLGLTRSRLVASLVVEWKPLSLDYFARGLHFWALHVLLLCLLLTLRRIDLTDLIVLGTFGFLAITARRHLWLFCVVCVPLLARHLSLACEWIARRATQKALARLRATAYGTAVITMLLMAWLAAGLPDLANLGFGVDREKYPIGAADFLERHGLTGPLFNTYDFGNYLLYRLYPRNLVFVDGRADVYGESLAEYDRIRQGKSGWRKVLRDRGVRVAVLRSKPHEKAVDEDLLNRLFVQPAWRLVFWDKVAAVFVRSPAEAVARLAPDTELRFQAEHLAVERIRSAAELQQVTAYLEARLAASRKPTALSRSEVTAVYANLGLCYEARGDFGKAAEQFRQLTVLKPEDPVATAMLGECLLRAAQARGAGMSGAADTALLAGAEKALVRAIRLNPKQKKALHNLGNLYYLTGRYRRAIEMHRRAFRLAPKDWRLPWAISFSCAKLGDLAGAREQLRTVLRLNPMNSAARQRLAELEAGKR